MKNTNILIAVITGSAILGVVVFMVYRYIANRNNTKCVSQKNEKSETSTVLNTVLTKEDNLEDFNNKRNEPMVDLNEIQNRTITDIQHQNAQAADIMKESLDYIYDDSYKKDHDKDFEEMDDLLNSI